MKSKKTQKHKGFLIEGCAVGYRVHWTVTTVPPKYQILLGVANVVVETRSQLFTNLAKAKSFINTLVDS
jgi:hypothetical protein